MTAGRTRHNSRDNATTQIKRKSIRHVSWPPLPANIVNHIFPTKGIPNDSIKSKSALEKENLRLRRAVLDLALDKQILQAETEPWPKAA